MLNYNRTRQQKENGIIWWVTSTPFKSSSWSYLVIWKLMWLMGRQHVSLVWDYSPMMFVGCNVIYSYLKVNPINFSKIYFQIQNGNSGLFSS